MKYKIKMAVDKGYKLENENNKLIKEMDELKTHIAWKTNVPNNRFPTGNKETTKRNRQEI